MVHQTEHLTRHCPRMMGLLKLFNHAIQINQTHEEIRSLQDAFMVLDAAALPAPPGGRASSAARSACTTRPRRSAMRSRFQEIWAASYPGVSSTTVGL